MEDCVECGGTGESTCGACSGRGRTGGWFGLFAKLCVECEGTGSTGCSTSSELDASDEEDDDRGGLLFGVSIFEQPLDKQFVSRVTGMTHAYVLSKFVTPSPLPLQMDFTFMALFQTCVQGLEDGSLEMDSGTLERQLEARQSPEDVRKLMALVRDNLEVSAQWNEVGMFGSAPAQRCFESLVLDFQTDPLVIVNYAALFYRKTS